MLEIVAIIGILLISIVLILKRFDLSIYLLLILSILLHKELFSFYQWDVLPIRIFMIALLLCSSVQFLWNVFSRKLKISDIKNTLSHPFLLLISLLWVIYGASLVFSFNIKASLLLYASYTTIVALGYRLVLYLHKNKLASEVYIKFYLFVTFVLTLFGYFQFYLYETTGKIIGALWNIPNNTPRIGSTFWDVNHYGALIAGLLPVSGALFLSAKTIKSRFLYFVISGSLAVSLFLTNSRTAWITDFIALLVFVAVLLYRRVGLKGFGYIFTGLLVIILPLVVMYSDKSSPFRAAVKGYFHYRLDSFDSHILLLRGSFEIFTKYPVLGGGYGSFFEHFNKTKVSTVFFGRDPAAFNTRVPAHTIWGELLSGSGILGFSTYLSLFILVTIVLLYVALKSSDNSIVLLSSSMASSYIGLHLAGIFYSYNSEFFWILTFLFFTYGVSRLKDFANYRDVVNYFTKANKVPLIVISSLALVLIFWQLGSTHLIPWDEAIYAKIAKNMVVHNSYLVESWKQGVVWYEKPPLYMWMVAGLMHLMGFTELASRLPSALFGLSLVIITFIFTKRLFGKTAAYFASLSLLTTTQFLYYSRAGMFDVTTAFFITAALMVYYITTYKKSNLLWLLIGLLIGFGTMVKGVIGLLPLPIILISDLIIYRRFIFKEYLLLATTLLAVIVPWHLAMYQKFGVAFFQNYIGYHVLDRAISDIEDKGRPIWWYFVVIKVSMRLWFLTLLASFPYAIYKMVKKDRVFSFLTLWSVFILVFFSLAKSKLVWYIIPLYPVVAIINGAFIAVLINKLCSKLFKKNFVLSKILLVYVLTIGVLFYLVVNRQLVYTGDLTGSQARLMQTKDRVFGTERIVYLDRIELPLALYYTDGPFEIIDFSPTVGSRVPKVGDDQPLVLITKKGRYAEKVENHTLPPSIVAEDGDWLLWYLPPKVGSFKLDKPL